MLPSFLERRHEVSLRAREVLMYIYRTQEVDRLIKSRELDR
jgi:hypothetical protein